MAQAEQSPLIKAASEQYTAYDMDALPRDLQRNSKDYYYLSVYPGLRHMVELNEETIPHPPDEIHNAYVHTPYCTGVCNFCSFF